jgi:flavin-dependent thymidylate synthase
MKVSHPKESDVKVDLIDYTGKGTGNPWYAAALMIWTKQTRVEMDPGGLEAILSTSVEEKERELRYMAATVPSSWEFCDFTFLISGVTRAFTHQLVRTRTASYAQQAMQVLNVSQGAGWDYHTGVTIAGNTEREEVYRAVMGEIAIGYKHLLEIGAKTEDARGVLPTNILTNIVMKANLRTMCDLLRKRASPRNQGATPGTDGEWTTAHREMKARMIEALPWTSLFLERTADKVAADAYLLLEQVPDKKLRTDLNKLIDQILTNVGSGE